MIRTTLSHTSMLTHMKTIIEEHVVSIIDALEINDTMPLDQKRDACKKLETGFPMVNNMYEYEQLTHSINGD